MQSKGDLEEWYETPDPWGYETNPDDLRRKEEILKSIPKEHYKRALDIGCGEGWITQDLPAEEVHGLELSEIATKRFPENITPVTEPIGKYDLVLATGVLYSQYNRQQIIDWVLECATGTLVIAGISDWLVNLEVFGKPLSRSGFKYRDYVQEVRVYDRSIS